MNWIAVLNILLYVLGKIKDTDQDGRPDVFDKYPNDPERK
jgi:hypothetical protein